MWFLVAARCNQAIPMDVFVFSQIDYLQIAPAALVCCRRQEPILKTEVHMDRFRQFTMTVFSIILLMWTWETHGRAQTPKGYVTGKTGINAQWAEDGESGQSVGGGAAVGYFFAPKWGAEFEVWIPAYMEKDGKQFRDILMGAAIVRRWKWGRLQPLFLIGLDYAKVELRRPGYQHTNSYGYIKTGIDLPLFLNRRWSLVPQFRLDLGGIGANLIRPALGISYHF
jgi:hypothetical protein